MGWLNSRGLSEVIVSLIVITLSIVAIVIVWVVVNNLISSGSAEIDVGKFTLDMKIKSVVSKPDGVDVTVKRESGIGEVSAIKFFFSDGITAQGFQEATAIKELDEETFHLNYSGIIKKVSIAPVLGSGSNAQTIDVKDSIDESTPFMAGVKKLDGLVSWWRFEGNVNDEKGINNGVNNGATLTTGKFGQGYNFIQDTDVITVTDTPSLRLENSNMTIIAWINIVDNNTMSYILSKQPYIGNGYGLGISSTPKYFFKIGDNLAMAGINALPKNNWIHLVGSRSVIPGVKNSTKVYLNGNLDKEVFTILSSALTTGDDLIIGNENVYGSSAFNGTIDEVMIFNRSLSDDEIKAMYNMNLG